MKRIVIDVDESIADIATIGLIGIGWNGATVKTRCLDLTKHNYFKIPADGEMEEELIPDYPDMEDDLKWSQFVREEEMERQ